MCAESNQPSPLDAMRERAEHAEEFAWSLGKALAGLLADIAYDEENPCGFLIAETTRINAENTLRRFDAHVEQEMAR